jgi:uncharacterized protein
MFPRFHRRKKQKIPRRRHILELDDSDCLLLDFYEPESIKPDAPIILIVHGLSGTSDSHYVVGLQRQLGLLGWPSVAMNCRGASEPNRLARAYHAGASDDIHSALTEIQKHSNRLIGLVGYSLGGSMCLKAISEMESSRLFAAVAVSVPLDFPKCANRMDRGFSRLYRKVIVNELIEQIEQKIHYLKSLDRHNEANVLRAKLATGPFKSFWEFDDRVVAPLHGFADVHDYYARCSPVQFLKTIRTPTLIIHSADDPFMTSDVIPTANQLSDCMSFELSRYGGHVGFISGSIRKPEYYLEKRIPQYLENRFRNRNAV